MRKRDKAGLSLAPVLLRVALGAVFLWAGLAKVMDTYEFPGEEAAILANLGVIKGPGAAPAPDGATPDPADADEGDDVGLATPHDSGVRLVAMQGRQYSAADFREPVEARMVNRLVVGLYTASHPGFDETTGAPKRAIWPAALGEGKVVQLMAWSVALGEIACGGAVLIGLATRLASFGLVIIMAGALWLSQIGPAIQEGTATLGFLPGHSTWSENWTHFFFPLSLLCMSLATMLLGAGTLSLDALLFRPKGEGDDLGAGEEGDE
jgi:uncharacterized membrane protein YphA (DoxX/SURF4 family)